MIKRIAALTVAATMLAGCLSPEERQQARLDRAAATCSQYGFTPQTDAFSACVQRDVAEQRERTRRAAQAFADSLNQFNMQQQINRPRYTSCNSFGYSLNCTTY